MDETEIEKLIRIMLNKLLMNLKKQNNQLL